MTKDRTKYYIPLESNPEVFTHLIRSLGVRDLEFVDVYSLDEEMIALVPRPVYALVMVFPAVSKEWEAFVAEREKRDVYEGYGENEEVLWLKQTIGNACGLYAILHAVCNAAREFIKPSSALDNLIKKTTPLPPADRALALEADEAIEHAHREAGVQGSSEAPEPEDNVNYHYIAYVVSRNGKVFEMDGDSKGPLELELGGRDREGEGEGDVLDFARERVMEYVRREEGNVHFSLMALVRSD